MEDKQRTYGDHPRRCGENRPVPVQSIGIRGSPPQVRGKLSLRAVLIVVDRITPAGAGKTKQWRCVFVRYWDHPRRCGENTACATICNRHIGSPPRMRGKLVDSVNANHGDRITPADAGKTRALREQGETHWDHPRGCGENCRFPFFRVRYIGSPPRMRGKRIPNKILVFPERITPADAGKTCGII